ncbi:MAG: MlaE family lipid ABC transporter permease subunit [Desulfobacteraceae bacterium]|nr:MAG: MlaE family lipid ABC transporter permease subunit [Desulfobacteraceae bacterium]
MKKLAPNRSAYYKISGNGEGFFTVHYQGKLDVRASATIIKELIPEIDSLALTSLTADIDDVSYIDDFGLILLVELKKAVKKKNGSFRIIDTRKIAESILSIKESDIDMPSDTAKPKRTYGVVVRFGETVIKNASNFKILVSFIGSVLFSFYHILRHPGSLRVDDTILCMEKTGANAVPIVALISFLLGLVISFMSSLQLQQFGANIYVASLVAIAMVSELGPIMTAIVVAGRSGSAFAAEIGTMKISEEIDALFVMGFDPTLFLAIPRIVASVIVVPLLTVFSNIFAIAGGLVVGVFILDLTISSYISQTIKVLTLFEVVWGMSKSVIFAILISWVGCLRGFQTRGGADAVGNAATSAVVSGIFLIILFDSMFAVGRSYWR